MRSRSLVEPTKRLRLAVNILGVVSLLGVLIVQLSAIFAAFSMFSVIGTVPFNTKAGAALVATAFLCFYMLSVFVFWRFTLMAIDVYEWFSKIESSEQAPIQSRAPESPFGQPGNRDFESKLD